MIILGFFLRDIIKVYNEKVILFGSVYLIMLHLQTLTTLIHLSLNIGLPGGNLVTSTIIICNQRAENRIIV